MSLFEKGLSQRKIAFKLKIPKSTVADQLKMMKLKRIDKGGRPEILTDRDENFCVNQMTTGKCPTVVKLSKEIKTRFDIDVHPDTISRALKRKGLESGIKKKKPALSRRNIKQRLDFAKSHQDWTVEDWKLVIFSDETKINRFNSDGMEWYWAKDVNALTPQSVHQTIKHGGGGIMMWGCMTAKGPGFATKIDSTMDQHLYKQILEDELMDTIEYYEFDEKKVIFQQDNDPKHTAKSVKEWLRDQEFKTMTWPSQSPDLNPIEHLWAHVKRKLNQFESPAKGMNELWERIEEVWNQIDAQTCLNLITSMPARIDAVLKAKGKWTKY